MRNVIRTVTFNLALSGLFTASAQVIAQDYDSLISDAINLRNQGEFVQAEASLRQALPMAQDTSEVTYLLAMVLSFQERHSEALRLLDESLQTQPDNQQLLLGRARVLSYTGNFQQASQIAERITDDSPFYLEAQNLSGRLALYQNRPVQAETLFRQVLTLETDNLEALVGLYDALLAQRRVSDADDVLLRAESIAPQHSDVVSRRDRTLPVASIRNTWSAGYARSRLNRPGFSDWQQRWFRYERQVSLDNAWHAQISSLSRFGQSDELLQVGVISRAWRGVPLAFDVGKSSTDNFSARWFGRAAATLQLNEAWIPWGSALLTPALQVSDYSVGRVWRAGAGLEYYPVNFNGWITPSAGWVRDENGDLTFSWAIGAHWQAHPDWRFGVSFSDGAETENKITTDTRSRSVYVRWQFSDAAALVLNHDVESRRLSYRRNTTGLSIILRH